MSNDKDYNYLLSLKSVREQARHVFEAAKAEQLSNFNLHEDKLDTAADYVVSVILRDWKPEQFNQIPPHGRWQHFNAGGKSRLDDMIRKLQEQGVPHLECARCVVDIMMVSVLLDAGAGTEWAYSEGGTRIGRSEGLAVASLYAFEAGAFGDSCVDARALQSLSAERLALEMQSTPGNLLVGLEGRALLLRSLGTSLLSMPEVFTVQDKCRPGNVIDYLLSHGLLGDQLDFNILWDVLQQLLLPAWPKGRATFGGKAIGDAWPLQALERLSDRGILPIQPFHKLTQWLAYSLTSAIGRLLSKAWIHVEDLTGLPEYRNGGAFVDLGVLSLIPSVMEKGLTASGKNLPQFSADSDVIVEWRALTVALLDEIALKVNQKLAVTCGDSTPTLSLAQILEAGTWKAGRELAQMHRPADNACSPILIVSDGTLF